MNCCCALINQRKLHAILLSNDQTPQLIALLLSNHQAPKLHAWQLGNHEPPQLVSLSPLLLSNHDPPQSPLLLTSHHPPHLTALLLCSQDPAPLSPLLFSNHQPLPDLGASRVVLRGRGRGLLYGWVAAAGGLVCQSKGGQPGARRTR